MTCLSNKMSCDRKKSTTAYNNLSSDNHQLTNLSRSPNLMMKMADKLCQPAHPNQLRSILCVNRTLMTKGNIESVTNFLTFVLFLVQTCLMNNRNRTIARKLADWIQSLLHEHYYHLSLLCQELVYVGALCKVLNKDKMLNNDIQQKFLIDGIIKQCFGFCVTLYDGGQLWSFAHGHITMHCTRKRVN